MLMKKTKIYLSLICLLVVVLIEKGCQHSGSGIPLKEHKIPKLAEHEVPVLWADMSLFITKNTPANSPTFASRAFGYFGLTMYESIVNGFKNKRSMAGQLNQLLPLPLPDEGKKYNWTLSLNAAQAFIIKNTYPQTSDENKLKIDSLEQKIEEIFLREESDKEVVKRSIKYGRSVAAVIFEWSKNDGGHKGYLKNFDSKMQQKSGKGLWKPPFFAQTISRLPLHPYWGENRTFLTTNSAWDMPEFLVYDSISDSKYYLEFNDVYENNIILTQQQKEIAMWWNDDPSDTFTPPGHSYNLVSIVVKAKDSDLITAAEAYARVGLSVADSFIICWKMKYHYFSERPSTFISENIDDEWEPFWPDPPFPAFPSGHATQAAAVATVLSNLYGENMTIVDNTHVGRKKDKIKNVEYKERRFSSFWEVAEETAYSRFLGGIHSNYDNVVGLSEGTKVGENVNNLKWNN